MKELYNYLSEQLKTINKIRWIDFNTGQLNEQQPPVDFPCALIDIDLPVCKDIGANIQQVAADFTITLAFKAVGKTNNKTPLSQQQLALLYFDTVDLVYKKLQGAGDKQFYKFSRKSVRSDNSKQGLKIIEVQFATSFYDRTASS